MRPFLLLLLTVLAGCDADPPVQRPGPQEPAVLHPVERVAYGDDWRFETTRTARPGEWVFVILRLPRDRCTEILSSQPDVTLLQMMPMVLSVPSGEGGRTGAFYEALPPRNADTCHASPYVLAEWRVEADETVAFTIGETRLIVAVTMRPFAGPRRPFFVGMGNANLITGHCPNGYCPLEAPLGRAYASLLVAHGLQPMQNWVRMPPIVDGVLDLDAGAETGTSFRQLVQAYAISGFVGFPRARRYSDRIAYLKALEQTVHREGLSDRAWVYAVDEPSDRDALIEELSLYRQYAPSVKVMVTTDRDPRLDAYVDIYAPVFNRIMSDRAPDFEDYDGNALWSYMSCMGSCGPHRIHALEGEKIPGPDTGLPDLLIDRPAARLFRFFEEGAANGVRAGLHYEVVEGYRLIPLGVDVMKDPWNFGGNGDGLLLFPGRPGEFGLREHMPIASFRLKLLRHALQTYW